MTMPQKLPTYDLEASDPGLPMAYETCLWLESCSEWMSFTTNAVMVEMSPTVAARVLGYALRFTHSQAGRAALSQEINDCDRDLELLAGLAHLYVFGLIRKRAVRNPTSPTPDTWPFQRPERFSQLTAEDAERLLRRPSLTARELRKLTLLRDNNCCVFTGTQDRPSADNNLDAVLADPAVRVGYTTVTHVMTQSLSEDIEGVTPAARAKFDWARTADAVIERFGGFSSYALLGDQGLNSPLNAFTSTDTPQDAFNRLALWLTPAKTNEGDIIANTYDVTYVLVRQQLPPEMLFRIGSGVRPRIEFKSLNVGSEVIPAPHPELIALHGACAKIAHMSGAAEYLDELFRETDAISVMTEPNAANELARSLKALQLHCR